MILLSQLNLYSALTGVKGCRRRQLEGEAEHAFLWCNVAYIVNLQCLVESVAKHSFDPLLAACTSVQSHDCPSACTFAMQLCAGVIISAGHAVLRRYTLDQKCRGQHQASAGLRLLTIDIISRGSKGVAVYPRQLVILPVLPGAGASEGVQKGCCRCWQVQDGMVERGPRGAVSCRQAS